MMTTHVSIPLFVEDDFSMGLHPLEFGIPYPPQHLSVVCVAYHLAGLGSQAELALAELNFRNESTGLASELA